MQQAGGWGAALRRRRAALLVTACVPVLVLVGLPFSGVRGPEIAGFTVGWVTLVLACDVSTAILLLGLSRNGLGLRPLLLAMAFLWSGALVLMLAFAAPGVVTDTPTFASDDPGWIWLLRHTGPPLIIAIALAPWPVHWERQSPVIPSRAVALLAASLVIGPGALLMLLTLAPDSLPAVLDPVTLQFDGAVMLLVLLVSGGAVVASVAGVVQRRSGSVEVWGAVAAVAWLGDVAFTFMYEEPFTLAFYGARLLGVAASGVVLGVILYENHLVRRRLADDNRDLEAQIDDLLEAQQLRDHVAAVVSHDMRAPIAGLQGYLEIVDDEREDDPVFVRRIHERCLVLVRRLSLLTEDLQAAAVAAHGDLQILPELLDVESQLAESAGGFPGLDLRIDCQPGLVAWADPLRLQQIVSNLVRNAERHGAEPVVVRVRSEPDGMVVFRVSDAGPGVSETFIPRLFERYSQGPDSAPGGSGLGLSVTRDLVRAHGGTVRYDLTEPAFIVTLPAAPTEIRTPNGRVISPPRRIATRPRAFAGGDAEDAG